MRHQFMDAAVLADATTTYGTGFPDDIQVALQNRPKETLKAVLHHIRLRHSAALYQTLGRSLSITEMKTPASGVERLSNCLRSWFPPE